MHFLLCFLALVVSVLLDDCSGCSPLGNELTLLQHAQYSNVILLGKVRRLVENPMAGTGGDYKNYVAVVLVHCILKGDVTPKLVNVTNVGVTPGRCSMVDMERNKDYLIMGYPENGFISHNDHQAYPMTPEVIGQALMACGLEPKYPTGVDESNAATQCPQLTGDCVPDVPATGLQEPPPPPSGREQPVPEALPEEEEVTVGTIDGEDIGTDDTDDNEHDDKDNPTTDDRDRDENHDIDTEDKDEHEGSDVQDVDAEDQGDKNDEEGDTIADEKDPVSAHQGGSDSIRACIWIIMLGAAAVVA